MSFELQFSIVNIKAISFYCEYGFIYLKYTADRLMEHIVHIMEYDSTSDIQEIAIEYIYNFIKFEYLIYQYILSNS